MASSIKQIQVDRLFGHFTYRIPEGDGKADLSRLFILYGDNGSGKTTILRILYHLLAHEIQAGHKTAVAKTPFARFTVTFDDGTYVSATRPKGQISGGYTLTLGRPGHDDLSIELETNHDGVIKGHDETLPPILNALESLGLNLYMLQDDRHLRGDSTALDEDPYIDVETMQSYRLHTSASFRRVAGDTGRWIADRHDPIVLVYSTIRRFEVWIRRHALAGSRTGQANSDTIYKDVLKRIATLHMGEPEGGTSSLMDLRKRVSQLGERAGAFSKYGLVPDFDAQTIGGILESAPQHNHKALYAVLNPYVEGLTARLDALEDAQQIIDKLITSINSFFLRKSVVFDIRGGLDVILDGGDRLDSGLLSSGERQVLILLCNCVTAPNKSIFVVDEPELSLNIKWQRQLTDALLACTHHSKVQFLLATHSFELLARHKGSVVPLQPVS